MSNPTDAPGRYGNDRRVSPHPDDGTWLVFDRADDCEYYLSPWGDLWAARDSRNHPVLSRAASFDEVVHALTGDPR